MMTRPSRILVLVAALALVLVYALPVWRITLEAPQYPEGLGMLIRVNTIVGVKQHDLDNINNLNHYIGMKRIEPDAIPEMKVMPVVVGAFIVLGVLTAALGRRKLLYGFLGVYLAFSVAGMVDFWKWEYDYGHDLDEEHAIIKIPGMSYQPPLIGSRQILNFKAHSWPGSGGWILIATGAALTGLALLEWRRGRRGSAGAAERLDDAIGTTSTPRASGRPLAAAALAVTSLTLASCGGPEPRPIVYGTDSCEACHMGLAHEGHGAELVTRTGRAYVFDSIECLVGFLGTMDDPESVHSAWVTDFTHPGSLVDAETAFYLVSGRLQSPMGLGLTAFAREDTRDGALARFSGEPLDWEGVRALVAEKWPSGEPSRGAMHPAHEG